MTDAWTGVTGQEVILVERAGPIKAGGPMTEEMVKIMEASRGLIGKWEYFGPSGREGVAVTRAMVEEAGGKLTSFKDFVQKTRCVGPE